MTDKEIISQALSEAPLYKKTNIQEMWQAPFVLDDRTFTYFCPTDQSVQTFKLRVEPDKIISLVEDKIRTREIMSNIGLQEFEEGGDFFNFTIQCAGTCQYCNEYKVHFLLRYESRSTREESYSRLIKIGQYPAFEAKPNRDLMRFLNEEDKENYKKALICRSQSYGIGCFAYLRRIVENEMIKLVEALSLIPRKESDNIKTLLTKFRQDHVMTSLIEGVYPYLPNSLKTIGDNPLKVLYGQLSGGIHEFTDDKCLEKAENMDKLLNFVVKKINEESSEVIEAREALKGLIK